MLRAPSEKRISLPRKQHNLCRPRMYAFDMILSRIDSHCQIINRSRMRRDSSCGARDHLVHVSPPTVHMRQSPLAFQIVILSVHISLLYLLEICKRPQYAHRLNKIPPIHQLAMVPFVRFRYKNTPVSSTTMIA